MKIKLLLYLSILIWGCQSNKKHSENAEIIKNKDVKKFPFDSDKSPLLFVDVKVNYKYPATFIIDNGTDENRQITIGRDFLRKYLIKDSSFLSEIRFTNDSIPNVSFDSFFIRSEHTAIFSLPKKEEN